jgi:hypothetical protein
MESEQGQQIFHLRPVGLTISVEMSRSIAFWEMSRRRSRIFGRNRINLGLVRGQLAAMEAKRRGE